MQIMFTSCLATLILGGITFQRPAITLVTKINRFLDMCFNTFFYVIQELIKSSSKPWARGIQIGLKATMQTITACRFLILFKYFIHDTKVN